MGVDRSDYIVYGWKLPYDIKDKDGNVIDIHDDKLLPYIEGDSKVSPYRIIADGMTGDYVVFGAIISDACDDWEGWDFVEIRPHMFSEKGVMDKYRELFNNNPRTYPTNFIFTHFW